MPDSPERAALTRLLHALDQAAPDLPRQLARLPKRGEFFGLFARHQLSGPEVRLVLVALAERLQGRPCITGSELVKRAAPDSAGRLAALALLTADHGLLGAGLLLPETLPTDGAAAQATLFRLSDHVFRLACDIFARQAPPAADVDSGAPYRNNAELLADLRKLSLLYRRRAAHLFHLDPWSGTGLPVADGAGVLIARARAQAARVGRRLAATTAAFPGAGAPDTLTGSGAAQSAVADRPAGVADGAADAKASTGGGAAAAAGAQDGAGPAGNAFPLLALRDKHALDLDALVILVTMLYQELVEGVGTVDAVDLVKLVSESEEDLLRRRHLLRPLQRRGLLHFEGAFSGKELTADASLPNEVVELMLGAGAPIDSNERIDFHQWLAQLDTSDPFFSDPDGSGAAGA